MRKYGKASLKEGLDLTEKEFKALLRKGGYRGSSNAAWVDYKKTIPSKPKKTYKAKKEETE